jgi:hypothetical protein
MITKRTIRVNKETEDEVICDCCGLSCLKHESLIDNPANPEHGNTSKVFEFMELKANWGYWSDHDTETWTAQICEKCVVAVLDPFVKFNKTHYM